MRKLSFTVGMFLSLVAAVAQPQLRKDNIDEVVKAMTLEEKASLLVGTSSDNLVPGLAGGTRAIPRKSDCRIKVCGAAICDRSVGNSSPR